MTLRYFGRAGFINRLPNSDDLASVKEGWDLARQIMANGEHDLVILDEINRVLSLGMLSVEEVIKGLNQRSPKVEVVLTGRDAPAELIEIADIVTEMYPVKHYYQAGVKARRGIEW